MGDQRGTRAVARDVGGDDIVAGWALPEGVALGISRVQAAVAARGLALAGIGHQVVPVIPGGLLVLRQADVGTEAEDGEDAVVALAAVGTRRSGVVTLDGFDA